MNITNKQVETLHLLRLEGLRREMLLHETQEAYNEAVEIENAVKAYVIRNNNYIVEIEGNDSENGNLITDARSDFMMSESVFSNDYLPKVREAFQTLYGIDNPLNNAYTWQSHKAFMDAEKNYYMLAPEFLKACGRAKEAEQLAEFVKGYMREDLKQKLKAMINEFITGLPVKEK